MPIPPANRPEEEAASPYERGRQVREQVIEMGEEDNVLFLDPPEIFDPAIVGLTDGMGPLRVVYDCDRCVEQIARRGNGIHEEASEYFEFNTLGAYVGEHGPLFVRSVAPLARMKGEPRAFRFKDADC